MIDGGPQPAPREAPSAGLRRLRTFVADVASGEGFGQNREHALHLEDPDPLASCGRPKVLLLIRVVRTCSTLDHFVGQLVERSRADRQSDDQVGHSVRCWSQRSLAVVVRPGKVARIQVHASETLARSKHAAWSVAYNLYQSRAILTVGSIAAVRAGPRSLHQRLAHEKARRGEPGGLLTRGRSVKAEPLAWRLWLRRAPDGMVAHEQRTKNPCCHHGFTQRRQQPSSGHQSTSWPARQPSSDRWP